MPSLPPLPDVAATFVVLASEVVPGPMTAASSAADSAPHSRPAGHSDGAPTSKYAASRVSTADLRMRSARPFTKNATCPAPSTVCTSRDSSVTPAANGSGPVAAVPKSPSRRTWMRDTCTTRFPRMVSSMPASHPSPPAAAAAAGALADDSPPASSMAAASLDVSHTSSPSSTRRRWSSACADSQRAVRSSTVSAASGSANAATRYSSSMLATTGALPKFRQGTCSESLPTTPLWTVKGRSRAFSASVFRRRLRSTTSPLNTATLRSLELTSWTYAPSTLFSTEVSWPSNMTMTPPASFEDERAPLVFCTVAVYLSGALF
mmetsp:Transcript_35955/g.89748  ORF Transcript_35955/g.89748 Transcript_35955/m.89748 type:complete len:320 (+) Transcript_35955:1171-2130(+)